MIVVSPLIGEPEAPEPSEKGTIISLRRLVAAIAATAAIATITAHPAAAAGGKLTLIGLGTYEIAADGTIGYSADLSGTPVAGPATGAVAATDGTLPSVGRCEPGIAILRVDDAQGRHVSLSSAGEVCALYLPLGVMQQFRGRWAVESTSLRKLTKTTGVFDLRFLNGQSDIYATS